jgi:hypothetical protein
LRVLLASARRLWAFLEKLDSPILLYQAQFLRGQILEVSGKTDEAYQCYQEARS